MLIFETFRHSAWLHYKEFTLRRNYFTLNIEPCDQGYGYSPSGAGGSRLLQLAEESSLPAFQSIENIVRAFGSVSMMLESILYCTVLYCTVLYCTRLQHHGH